MRRAQVEGELAAERRVAERAARERAERAGAHRAPRGRARPRSGAAAGRPTASSRRSRGALAAVAARVEALDAELLADREAGEGVASALRACATEEAEIQTRLRERGEAVTARRGPRPAGARRRARRRRRSSTRWPRGSGLEAAAGRRAARPRDRPTALRARIERLQRRREQLGPVNPLAKAEYDEALAHVEELERQREDLETALRELQGR